MKRKSVNLRTNTFRIPKKQKTDSYSFSLKPFAFRESFQESEKFARDSVEDFRQILTNSITEVGNSQSLSLFTHYSFNMFLNISTFLQPDHDEVENDKHIKDRELQRINFDPICGFDKLITHKNKIKASSFCSIQSSPIAERYLNKSNGPGVFHFGRKQPRHSRMGKNELVLLHTNKPEAQADDQTELQEAFYRNCVFLNMGLEKKKTSQADKPLKQGREGSKPSLQEDCQYDYSGNKINLVHLANAVANPRMIPNNVLKTSYKIVKNSNSVDSKSQHRQEKPLYTLQRKIASKQILQKSRSKPETVRDVEEMFLRRMQLNEEAGNMKTTLQSKFKSHHIKLKQLETNETLARKGFRLQ